MGQGQLLYFALGFEHGDDALEQGLGAEHLDPGHVILLLDLLHDENVIDEAEQEVELRNDQDEDAFRRSGDLVLLIELFEEHE